MQQYFCSYNLILNKIIRRMYKVGIMLMGKAETNTSTVKQIVLEVESKTRVKNLFEYLLELDKIVNTHVFISLEKKGRPLSEDSTISQMLKYTKPQNGLIRMYLYERSEEESMDRLELKRSRSQINSSSIINPEKGKNSIRDSRNGEDSKKKCCCF